MIELEARGEDGATDVEQHEPSNQDQDDVPLLNSGEMLVASR